MTVHPLSEQELVKRFIDIVGADRLLFRSDNNFLRTEEVLEMLHRLGVKGEDKENIMHKNVERLLALHNDP